MDEGITEVVKSNQDQDSVVKGEMGEKVKLKDYYDLLSQST